MRNHDVDFSVTSLLRENERIDDLQYKGLRIIQHPGAFCFGMDAVLLADFATLRPRDVVADMGTGTGILPVLLSEKQQSARFEAFEWQSDMADMAGRTMLLNGLKDRVRIHTLDMRHAAKAIGYESVDAVVCNPPYGKQNCALPNPNEKQRLARHETECTLQDVACACASVLRNQGRVSMVFPAQRMLELMDALRAKRLEPKRVRMVCAREDRPPYLMLVEAMKNGRSFLQWMPPLIVRRRDGLESDEIRRVYHQPPLPPPVNEPK